jgi:hypothetical protein
VSKVIERSEDGDGKLVFRTRVLPTDTKGINPEGLRAEGIEDVMVLTPEDGMEATLQREVRAREFDVRAILTHTQVIRVLACDKVSAEEAAYWRLSSDRETPDATIIDEQLERRYEVSD